jgi:hypothetical protein
MLAARNCPLRASYLDGRAFLSTLFPSSLWIVPRRHVHSAFAQDDERTRLAVAKQAAVVSHRARICTGHPQRGPKQHLVWCQHGTSQLLLECGDHAYRNPTRSGI